MRNLSLIKQLALKKQQEEDEETDPDKLALLQVRARDLRTIASLGSKLSGEPSPTAPGQAAPPPEMME